jgi:hypothetical protein
VFLPGKLIEGIVAVTVNFLKEMRNSYKIFVYIAAG